MLPDGRIFLVGGEFSGPGHSDKGLTNTADQLTVLQASGSVVTTLKNTVDHVVTEWGVADLRGRSLAQRAHALIRIAHPDFRDELGREARLAGLLH